MRSFRTYLGIGRRIFQKREMRKQGGLTGEKLLERLHVDAGYNLKQLKHDQLSNPALFGQPEGLTSGSG
jgi:hypothetical protein